jgi:ribose transport system permease protein
MGMATTKVSGRLDGNGTGVPGDSKTMVFNALTQRLFQDRSKSFKRSMLSQESIVLFLSIVLFVIFASFVSGFASTANLLSLVRSVSVLGILGIGMALVVIGRGMNLSLVATMAITVAWTLALIGRFHTAFMPMLIGISFAAAIGIGSGLIIAYVEVPAIFATLAMGTLVYGIGRFKLIDLDVVYVPNNAGWIKAFGADEIFGVPTPVILFAAVALVAHGLLRHTKIGKFIYAEGDNYVAARITGIPVRPMIVLQYLLSSLIGFLAGMVTAASVASMNTRIVNSTLIYDVILVVVLGGVGLSGGKGGIRNVIVGTLLIGILLNGMTILDVQYTVQNVIKSSILLVALVVDSVLNPRDEQVAQQGDI